MYTYISLLNNSDVCNRLDYFETVLLCWCTSFTSRSSLPTCHNRVMMSKLGYCKHTMIRRLLGVRCF